MSAAAWRLTPIPLDGPFVEGVLAGLEAEPFALEVDQRLGGTTFQLELRDWRPCGARAICAACGELYSTSPYAPTHPCLEVPIAPASPWDPYQRTKQLVRQLRELEHGRDRADRCRPHSPSELVSPPVDDQTRRGLRAQVEAHERHRCFVCRKRIGSRSASEVTIQVTVRGQPMWFYRHQWCRARSR